MSVNLGPDDVLVDLVRETATALSIPYCHLVTSAGHRLASSSTVAENNLVDGDVITGVVVQLPKVFASRTGAAFAVVKSDGSVVTWGRADYGGDSSAVKDEIACDVQQVAGTEGAFAAVKSDGSVVTWGDAHRGGDSSAVKDQIACDV